MSGQESDALRHSARFEVVNRLGLHARSAVLLAETAARFDACVTVTRDVQTVDAKSVLELMLLAATRGTTLEVAAVGPDALAAVEAVGELIRKGFHE
jgi:phosphocarrier protein